MDDRGRIAMSIGVGALLGGVAGYLLLTERGRDLRVNLEPRLNDLLREVDGLRTTFERTRAAVAQGVATFNQLVSEPTDGKPADGKAGAQTPRAHGGGTPAPSGPRPAGPTLWTKDTSPSPGSTH